MGHCKTLGVTFGNGEVEAPVNTMTDTLEEAKVKTLLDTCCDVEVQLLFDTLGDVKDKEQIVNLVTHYFRHKLRHFRTRKMWRTRKQIWSMKMLAEVTAQAKAGTVLVILDDVEAEALFETQVDTPSEANAERLGDTQGDVEGKGLFDTLADTLEEF